MNWRKLSVHRIHPLSALQFRGKYEFFLNLHCFEINMPKYRLGVWAIWRFNFMIPNGAGLKTLLQAITRHWLLTISLSIMELHICHFIERIISVVLWCHLHVMCLKSHTVPFYSVIILNRRLRYISIMLLFYKLCH